MTDYDFFICFRHIRLLSYKHCSFLTEPVIRAAADHAVTEVEAEIVHRLAQHGGGAYRHLSVRL